MYAKIMLINNRKKLRRENKSGTDKKTYRFALHNGKVKRREGFQAKTTELRNSLMYFLHNS